MSIQDPDAPSTGLLGVWRALAAEPALLECALVLVVGVVLWLLSWRIHRLVESTKGRALLQDHLLGVEQVLAEDYAGARPRLEKVLAEDPENYTTRVLYGEVLAVLGEPAEAHKQHLLVQHAWGEDSLRNTLGLGRALLATGRAAEAVDVLAPLGRRYPEVSCVLETLLEAQWAAGLPEDAGVVGSRLAPLLTDPAHAARVRARAAAALVLAARTKLRTGDTASAQSLAARATALSPMLPAVARLEAQVLLRTAGKDAAVRRLLAAHDTATAGSLAPMSSQESATALVPRSPGPGSVTTTPTYICALCGGAVPSVAAACVRCGAATSGAVAEPSLSTLVESPGAVLDEIEANRAYVRRRLDAAVRGEDAALDDLVEIGEPTVEEILLFGTKRPEHAHIATVCLRRMGPSLLPAMVAAWLRIKERRTLPVATRSGTAEAQLLGRVVQGFGREALPQFEAMLRTTDRDLRKIILDFYLGLGDQTEFAKVLDHFPGVEVLHRLNAASPEALSRLLQTLESGSFLSEVLLLERTFEREVDLVLALASESARPTLVRILVKRGAGAVLTPALIEHLPDPTLGAAVGQVLDGLGLAAADYLLSAFADLDRAREVRSQLSCRIAGLGPKAIAKICALVGPSPSNLDDDVIALLAAIGEPGAAAMAEAYQRSGFVERLAGPLVSRYTNRRVIIVKALATAGAGDTLRQLLRQETDANLKLRLAQSIARLDAAASARQPTNAPASEPSGPQEAHGQAG